MTIGHTKARPKKKSVSRGSRKKFGRAIVIVSLGSLLTIYLASTLLGLLIVHQSPDIPFDSKISAEMEALSSVDYYACCGLGHRLIRMSLAHYVAKLKGFSLRSFWGWCGEKQPIEVFSYLFRPYSPAEVQHVTSRNDILPFYNEVPGFSALVRRPTFGNDSACLCHEDKIEADFDLYMSLRNRFRQKPAVDAFVKKHFANATAIGIHVRAGNGEGGDFVRKGRGIDNPEIWVDHVCGLIHTFLQEQGRDIAPPVLYIATDTPSMVSLFRKRMARFQIPVFDLPQEGRLEEGQGVLFGESDKVHNKGALGESEADDDYSSCLRGWTETLSDMFVLSHADVVIAGKPSSFSQTLPMSLAFGKKKRKLKAAFCEIIPKSEERIMNKSTTIGKELPPTLQCYDSYLDWCCNYSTWIKLRNKKNAKEFVRFLLPQDLASFSQRPFSAMRNRTSDCLRPRRGRAGGGLKDKCLPHRWQ